jgi:hypothetical protein
MIKVFGEYVIDDLCFSNMYFSLDMLLFFSMTLFFEYIKHTFDLKVNISWE